MPEPDAAPVRRRPKKDQDLFKGLPSRKELRKHEPKPAFCRFSYTTPQPNLSHSYGSGIHHRSQRNSICCDLAKGTLNMSTLTHHFEDSPHSSERQNAIRTGTAKIHLPKVKQFCLGTLVMLSAGGLLAGLIVLRTAIYFSRFHY